MEEHSWDNPPQHKWPNQAALLHQELHNLGHENPQWNTLISAAQDAITAIDTTWLKVTGQMGGSYHGSAANRNPGRGQMRGRGHGRGRRHTCPLNNESA